MKVVYLRTDLDQPWSTEPNLAKKLRQVSGAKRLYVWEVVTSQKTLAAHTYASLNFVYALRLGDAILLTPGLIIEHDDLEEIVETRRRRPNRGARVLRIIQDQTGTDNLYHCRELVGKTWREISPENMEAASS